LLSCESKEQNPLVGNWVDQKTEFAQISISDSNGDLTITTRGKQHPIKSDGDRYVVEISNRKYPLFYNEIDKVLSFNNIFYIRENESLKNIFLGKWSSVNKEESLVFNIRVENGGLLWEVIKDQQEPVQYYPNRTKEGFAFTYEDQLLFFTMIDNCIVDSKGRKFCKS
jgi:hypothetical protein